MFWRIIAIIAAIFTAYQITTGMMIITTGYRMQALSNDTGIVTLYHMNEIIIWLWVLVSLSAAIFFALMDIGDSVRKRG